jgi:uncharacterized YigZ family protein
MVDSYITVKAISEGIYKEKGSRFISYVHPVSNEEQIKDLITDYRKKYFDARHHCYAWQLGVTGDMFRANDDGEPSGTAGKPILGQIKAFGVTNVFVMVVRYFGGVKLGTGGLVQAYKLATADALQNAEMVEKTVNDYYTLKFGYDAINDVMKVCKDENLPITNQQFGLSCELSFNVRQSQSEVLVTRLLKVEGVDVTHNFTL